MMVAVRDVAPMCFESQFVVILLYAMEFIVVGCKFEACVTCCLHHHAVHLSFDTF